MNHQSQEYLVQLFEKCTVNIAVSAINRWIQVFERLFPIFKKWSYTKSCFTQVLQSGNEIYNESFDLPVGQDITVDIQL